MTCQPGNPEVGFDVVRGMDSGIELGRGLTRERRVGGIRIQEYVHPPGHRLAWHQHQDPVLVVVREGGYEQHTPRRDLTCTAGSVAFVPPAARHRERLGDRGARSLLVWFEPGSDLGPLERRGFEMLGGGVDGAAERLEQSLGSPSGDLEIECCVAELLDSFSGSMRFHGRPPRWLRRVRDMLEDRLTERLDLSALAAEAGVARSHVARAFRTWYRVSPGELQRTLRLERARRELAEGRKPIAALAVDCGFYDQSHLTNAFRDRFGMTPATFRRTA